jgi:hypothetical protein
MEISHKSAIELGQIIAQRIHGISVKDDGFSATYAARKEVLNIFGDIADIIKDSEARIQYCRAFREKLTTLDNSDKHNEQ